MKRWSLTLTVLILTVSISEAYQKAPTIYFRLDPSGSLEARTGDDDLSHGATIEIEGLAFQTAELRVSVGESVIWINRDDVPHTATADDGSFDTGVIGAGETAQITFERAGTFSYYCAPHPFMKATIVVE